MPKFRNWLPMWDVQVLWKLAFLSNLCPCSLVYPVIQLLFKSSHSLLNVFAKFKPIFPAGVNHSCSIIPAEKLSKEVSQIFIETSDSGCLLAEARTSVGHGRVSPAGNLVLCLAPPSQSLILYLSGPCLSLCQLPNIIRPKRKRGQCVFLSSTFSSISTSSKIMPGSCKHKQSLIAAKKIRPLR